MQQSRKIRSFVRHQGRMTSGQQYALSNYWQNYGLTSTIEPFSFAEIFARVAPTFIEIGFGMGQSLLHMATTFSEHNYIGIEVYQPGVGALLSRLQRQQLYNVRIISVDAITVFEQSIPDHSLAGILIFFPDPWPKRRHHKRRLIQTASVNLLARKLQRDAYLHIATDSTVYAKFIQQQLSSVVALSLANTQNAEEIIQRRPLTKYEQRGQSLGHM